MSRETRLLLNAILKMLDRWDAELREADRKRAERRRKRQEGAAA